MAFAARPRDRGWPIANATDILADPWFAPLSEGETLRAIPKEMSDGAAKSIFLSLGIQSVILVPITVEGSLWGHVGLDDCTTERTWSSAEINILKIAADMFGGAFARDRYINRLKRREHHRRVEPDHSLPVARRPFIVD